MARSATDIDDEFNRLWGLVGELSEQLYSNRALVAQLKATSENVKGQAAHAGAGFPLRRFNLDISNEEFQSELEAFSSHLVLENQQLQHENKQLNALLKEYEQTLETVMGKFRGVSHASQQHDLSLHSYYTSLLQQLQTAHSSAQLHDSTSLSTLLTRLSTLLRSALRSLGGEETDLELADQLPGLIDLVNDHTFAVQAQQQQQQQHVRSTTPPSPTQSTATSSSALVTGTNAGSSSGRSNIFPRAPTKPVHFPGFIPGSSGGYNGTEGQADWSLEREMEIMRLEEENRSLREMLSISSETNLPLPPNENEDGDGEGKKEGVESPAGERSRKSSLTIEELEQGAAEEAEDRQKFEEYQERSRNDYLRKRADTQSEPGATDNEYTNSNSNVATSSEGAGTGTGHDDGGYGDGGHVGAEGENEAGTGAGTKPRLPLAESVLGFETDIPPPENAIVDEPDAEASDPNME